MYINLWSNCTNFKNVLFIIKTHKRIRINLSIVYEKHFYICFIQLLQSNQILETLKTKLKIRKYFIKFKNKINSIVITYPIPIRGGNCWPPSSSSNFLFCPALKWESIICSDIRKEINNPVTSNGNYNEWEIYFWKFTIEILWQVLQKSCISNWYTIPCNSVSKFEAVRFRKQNWLAFISIQNVLKY